MELLNLVVIFTAASIVLARPDQERIAFRLAVASVLLMIFVFLLATRSAWLPGVNY